MCKALRSSSSSVWTVCAFIKYKTRLNAASSDLFTFACYIIAAEISETHALLCRLGVLMEILPLGTDQRPQQSASGLRVTKQPYRRTVTVLGLQLPSDLNVPSASQHQVSSLHSNVHTAYIEGTLIPIHWPCYTQYTKVA